MYCFKGAATYTITCDVFLPSAYAVGNNFSQVYLSVCLYVCMCVSVHMSVCVFVQMITFEELKVGTSFLVHTYIFIITRSSLSTKVIRSSLLKGQGHRKANAI